MQVSAFDIHHGMNCAAHVYDIFLWYHQFGTEMLTNSESAIDGFQVYMRADTSDNYWFRVLVREYVCSYASSCTLCEYKLIIARWSLIFF